jgi:hypothetical protein
MIAQKIDLGGQERVRDLSAWESPTQPWRPMADRSQQARVGRQRAEFMEPIPEI